MILNIETKDVLGNGCNKINVIGLYDDMETVYNLKVTLLKESGGEAASEEISIQGEDYAAVDWNSHEQIFALIEQKCNVKIIK